jgi:hypothetical protein
MLVVSMPAASMPMALVAGLRRTGWRLLRLRAPEREPRKQPSARHH